MLFGKHVNKYYLRYAHFFLLGIAALVFVDVFQLRIPDIIGDIIDHLHDKTLTSPDLLQYMKRLGLISLIMFVGRFLWRICCFGNGIRIECDMRNELFSSMQNLSQEYFQENKTGALMALYTNDLTIIRRCFGPGTVMLVDAIVLGTMAFIKMLAINVPLANVANAMISAESIPNKLSLDSVSTTFLSVSCLCLCSSSAIFIILSAEPGNTSSYPFI